MNRTLITAALLFALPAASLAAPRVPEDQPKPPTPPSQQERQHRRLERAAEFLKLSEAQRASIKAIHEKNRDAAKVRRESAQAAAKAFHEAARDPKVTTDQLRRLHQAMADARFEAFSSHRAMQLEVRSLLTPEQREQAATLRGMALERRRERLMRDHRGPGMGPGMGRGMREGRGPGGEGRPGFEG